MLSEGDVSRKKKIICLLKDSKILINDFTYIWISDLNFFQILCKIYCYDHAKQNKFCWIKLLSELFNNSVDLEK